ncbi:hypothetical protein [Petrocella sp. FN5]|uniref:hypothetical protein n=1 Tax=Petrocella sp. FN5 TaxID=3032002 RepID=UPI0023DAB273|nr:hypothetical protein [Petrocella sp. FN5]MDF1617988.1 hypothetical protein [Petrocella sp. FN5]
MFREEYVEIKVLVTYSKLTGQPRVDREIIIDELRKYDYRTLLIVAAHLLNTANITDNCKRPYNLFLRANGVKYNETFLFNNVLICKQGIYYLAKWALIYSDNLSDDYLRIDPTMLNNILHLICMLNDYLPNEEVEALSYIYKNMKFNSKRFVYNEILRSFYIYTEIATDIELFEDNEYIDFNNDFVVKYSYTIKEYLASVFNLYTLHSTLAKESVFGNDIDNLLKNVKNPDVMRTIISDYIGNRNEYTDWAQDTLDNSWNYVKFMEKPLFSLTDNRFLSLSEELISNLIFEGLYHKIRHIYPDDDTRIIAFLGRPFELYISELCKEAACNSDLEHIDEFIYGDNNEKSSDSYIISGGKLVIIEAKAIRPHFSALIENSDDSLFKQVRRLYIKPINQAINAYNNINATTFKSFFSEVTDIYIISVTLESIQPFNDIISFASRELDDSLAIRGFFNMNVEEFEALCSLMNSDYDIYNILDDYMESGIPFANYLYSEGIYSERLDFLIDTFNKVTEEIRTISFSRDDNDCT